jgi:cytochrome o ubiquinol oxidase subunit 1
VIGVFSLVLGFALVWHIWWMAIAGLGGIVATLVIYSSRDNDGYYLPASTVRCIEEKDRGKRVVAHAQEVEREVS